MTQISEKKQGLALLCLLLSILIFISIFSVILDFMLGYESTSGGNIIAITDRELMIQIDHNQFYKINKDKMNVKVGNVFFIHRFKGGCFHQPYYYKITPKATGFDDPNFQSTPSSELLLFLMVFVVITVIISYCVFRIVKSGTTN